MLPLGTANSFARTLGIPLDLDGAIEVIANGAARTIDLGCINGDYFLNAAAIGLAPKVAETRAARAEALARHGRLSALGGLVGGQFPRLPRSRSRTASGRIAHVGDRGADRQRHATMAGSS